MPWWNTPPEVAAPPVTLERVCAALRRLGLDPVVRDGRTQVVLYRYPCTLRLLSPAPAAPDQSADAAFASPWISMPRARLMRTWHS